MFKNLARLIVEALLPELEKWLAKEVAALEARLLADKEAPVGP